MSDPEIRTRTQTVTVTVTASPDVETPTGPTVTTGPTGPTSTGPTGATGADSTLDSPFPLGDSAGAYGWQIEVLDYNQNANTAVEQANQFNDPPRRGTYVVVTARFERTEGGSSDPWFDIQAALVVQGETFAEPTGPCCLPDAWIDVGNIPVGGSGTGEIIFDVPRAGLADAVLYLIITDPRSFDEAEGFFALT